MPDELKRKCSKCGNVANVEKSVYIHRFPKPGKTNLLRARCWAKYCWPDQDWLSIVDLMKIFSNHKVLCGRHFEDVWFTDDSKKRLCKFSVPGEADYTRQMLQELREDSRNMETSSRNLNRIANNNPVRTQLNEDGSGYYMNHAEKENDVSVQQQQNNADHTYHKIFKENENDESAEQENRSSPAYMIIVENENDEPDQKQQNVASPAYHKIINGNVKDEPVQQQQNVASPAYHKIINGNVKDEPVQQQQNITSPAYHKIIEENENGEPVLKQQNITSPAYSVEYFEENEDDESVQLQQNEVDESVQLQQNEGGPINFMDHVIPNPLIIPRKPGILQSLRVSRMKHLTPREQKLVTICKKAMKNVNRLKRALKRIKDENKLKKIALKDQSSVSNLKIKNSFLSPLSLTDCSLNKTKGRRYLMDHKLTALSLYNKSPASYNLLSKYITIPSRRTLDYMLKTIPLNSGINEEVFTKLKDIAVTNSKSEDICILSFYEIPLRKNLKLKKTQDQGNGKISSQTSSSAVVFMVAGITKSWKQPVVFHLSDTSVTAEELTVIIKEIINECIKIGLNILATVCDSSQINVKALNLLGSSKDDPYFSYLGNEIVTIIDPLHLLKCTRNLFMKYDVGCTIQMDNTEIYGRIVEGIAKWSHVKLFYELDNNNSMFVYAPALTEYHIRPNTTKQKTSIELAAQVFSHSVAVGMMSKVGSNELPSGAYVTAMLLHKFDQLFDSLNADSPEKRKGQKYATNITHRSGHEFLFNETRQLINTMVYINCKTRPRSQDGWIRTINGVERLSNNMRSLGLNSLSTRRVNLDSLINSFDCIRYYSGSKIKPTVSKFIAGIKTAIIQNFEVNGCEGEEDK